MHRPAPRVLLTAQLALLMTLLILSMGPAFAGEPSPASAPTVLPLTLDDCIRIALERNARRPASAYAVMAAEEQHRQALSAWMPRLLVRSSVTQMDEPLNFIFPQDSQAVSLPLPPALGGPINNTTIIPEKEIKVADKRMTTTSVGLTYPLYTGGVREAMARQARRGIDAAREEARRNDLELIRDVKRYYYGAVIARNVRQITEDTLAQLEATLDLTERMYKGGAGKVKKTDYLRNLVMVEGVRAALGEMRGTEVVARAAVVNTLGLDWQTPIELVATEAPIIHFDGAATPLVNACYEFNPDWKRLHAGLAAAEAKIREARGGTLPTIALMGSLNYVDNSYDKGMVSPANKRSWAFGAGMEFPIFDGNLTPHRVREARARLKKLQQEKILLREGLALRVQQLTQGIVAAQSQTEALDKACNAATENRELNVRAYQDDLVETKDVLEAQMTEAFMKVGREKAKFDHVANRATLDEVIGREVTRLLSGDTSAPELPKPVTK